MIPNNIQLIMWPLCVANRDTDGGYVFLCVCGDFEQIMPLSMIDRNWARYHFAAVLNRRCDVYKLCLLLNNNNIRNHRILSLTAAIIVSGIQRVGHSFDWKSWWFWKMLNTYFFLFE